MDVRISYAIDLDEVPDKIADMLAQLETGEISKNINIAMQLIEMSNHEMGNSIIDQVRRKLAQLDRSLNDVQMILNGYLGAKRPPNPEPAEAQDAD